MKPRPPLLIELGLLAEGRRGAEARDDPTRRGSRRERGDIDHPIDHHREAARGAGSSIPGAVLRSLAELHRADRPLVLLAERPDRWAPTRNRVDRALEGQSRIEREIQRGGGELDAVLYLDFGLFSRRRKRREMLTDLADRYGTDRQGLVAVVSSSRMADAVRDAVGQVITAGSAEDLVRALAGLR